MRHPERLSRFLGALLALSIFGTGWWIRARIQTESLVAENVEPGIESGRSGRTDGPRHPPHPAAAPPELPRDFRFTDVTEAMGIRFRWEPVELDAKLKGRERLFYVGSGVAVADFNGDGWMDIFFPNGKQKGGNHLYINQGGRGFAEAAEAWGVAALGEDLGPVGPVVFDYDNDGKPDLYVAGMGCAKLLHNTGTRFVDVSRQSGLGDCRNSVSAVPIDFDGDGFLDLYVIRYWPALDYFHLDTFLVFSEDNVDARNGGEKTLYRNRGDGTFVDVTREKSFPDTHWGWEAVAADFLGDGVNRIYLANDFGPDQLLTPEGGGLRDDSWRLGFPDRRFGMGVSVGDLSGDGLPHVHVSNEWVNGYEQHGNFLWKFDENGKARDEAIERGTLNCGWAWGSAFADFDLDGRSDLYVANGFITGKGPLEKTFPMMLLNTVPGMITKDIRASTPVNDDSIEGRQVGCLFWNRGSRFDNVSPFVGLNRDWDGRGVALIDFDNNGSQDLVISTQNGPPHLLKNGVAPGDRWIRFRLVGGKSNRDAAGARVEVNQDGSRQYRWAQAGRTGFLAASDPRLHFGLPGGGKVEVTVRWPTGTIQRFHDVPAGKDYVLREGEELIFP